MKREWEKINVQTEDHKYAMAFLRCNGVELYYDGIFTPHMGEGNYITLSRGGVMVASLDIRKNTILPGKTHTSGFKKYLRSIKNYFTGFPLKEFAGLKLKKKWKYGKGYIRA